MTSVTPLSLASRIERDCTRRLKAWNEAVCGARDLQGGAPLHDLRVASRRLLVTLSVWRELFGPRRRLGPARDLEAQAARLAALASSYPDEEKRKRSGIGFWRGSHRECSVSPSISIGRDSVRWRSRSGDRYAAWEPIETTSRP